MAYWTVATQIAITVTFSIATHRKKEFTVWHYTITPMTKISILTIFRAKSNIDTKRLWQKSSEKIAQFLLLLLKGVYDGYSNDNVKKSNNLQNNNSLLHVHDALLYISFPSLQDYNVKMPNFRFNEERKQTKTNLSFLRYHSLTHPRLIQAGTQGSRVSVSMNFTPGEFAHIW